MNLVLNLLEEFNRNLSSGIIINALLNKTADFEIACRIRRYIDAIKNDPTNPDNNPDWIDWASKKADWIDPTVAREDEFFGKRKHGVDADQKELKRRW